MSPEEQNKEQSNNDEEKSLDKTKQLTETPSISAKTNSGIGIKDLLVPLSVVIAGAFIGLGLYLGGIKDIEPVADSGEQDPLQALVVEAGVSIEDVEQCVNGGEMTALVQADVDNALATGGRGTPWSIIIGPEGKTYPVNGALPAAAIQQTIELARSGADSPTTDGSPTTDQVNPVTSEDHIKGDINAPIKVVEYSDFDCPFCGRFHETMNQVVSQNDDVAWVYRHFPLDQLHPNARTIALISECVAELGDNDAFWTFTDGYFAL